MSSLLQRNEPNVTNDRNKYVGGSDVPVILGISKYKTQYELALEKSRIIKSEFVGNEYTQFGHAIEPQIREYINLTTEFNFVETTTIDEEKQLRSNTDGVDKKNRTLLEIKSYGSMPTVDIYKPQMQLYMYQNDLEKGL
ncbi:MAG TPA: YqaJ viral recombinase family protein, partial [Massilibacterium sp.]|nr:YqaJ viral recombinase family protein [Massilibacterium sp.]